MRFSPAPEYQVFPTRDRPLKPYQAAVLASAHTRELIRSADPEVVVVDILTVAAALAAECEERPWVTLVPHVMPMGQPGFPVYALGAVRPRTPLGDRLWRLHPAAAREGRGAGPARAERRARAGRAAAAVVRPRRHLKAARAGGDVPAARVSAIASQSPG